MQVILRAIVLLTLMWPVQATADEAAAREVIQSQLDAFQRDDFEEAFTYASPTIKGLFGTPDRFGQMVMNGYPMIWRPSASRFGVGEPDGDAWIQRVIFEDLRGRTHVAEYTLIETDEGWQINGVTLLPNTGVGT
ncbi:DUF4864 domain-containing protein [Pontivivens insulae]|uniref:DUF4864 domain-containing protein n=1 Tax=Pontivivens insulae TaxID=1639689 RepID=A0A2R8AER4_9RHOB|nr:DUF4864 domain-containing protein [Pontivivens insulae]RED11975.1 uncharacterized protein DUF4864 [Pontivivens insulae]SPF30731.1 hypothetical protein POI8812_03073 [Pontivivens insulae]